MITNTGNGTGILNLNSKYIVKNPENTENGNAKQNIGITLHSPSI
jgi:hypothetical protein